MKSLFTILLSLITICVSAQLELISNVNFQGTFHTDVWGYVDSEGREYALVGDNSFEGGVGIFDVTDPANPIETAFVEGVPGFDIKVWSHYVYAVSGGSGGQGAIIDISDVYNPQVVGGFNDAHNIFISEQGYMYNNCTNEVYNLNNNPTNPTIIQPSTSAGCHDATVVDGILYSFDGYDGTLMYDVNDPNNPQLLGTIYDDAIVYNHSGWVTEDRKHLFICDELITGEGADITVWNIEDPTDAQKVDEFVDNNAIVHNLYIIGDYAYVSYYTAGIRIFNVSDPTNIQVVEQYDTAPDIAGETFRGAFGMYPFAPSGNIYAVDWDNGLFVFSHAPLTLNSETPNSAVNAFSIAPSIVQNQTTIKYELSKKGSVQIQITNALGQVVQRIEEGEKVIGIYEQTVEMNALANGVYFAQLMIDNRIVANQKVVKQ